MQDVSQLVADLTAGAWLRGGGAVQGGCGGSGHAQWKGLVGCRPACGRPGGHGLATRWWGSAGPSGCGSI